MERDEEKGGIHVNTKIYKVTHYTNTRMVLNSLEETLRILLHVIDNTMQLYLSASSTNSQLAKEVPSCEVARWWFRIHGCAWWMLYQKFFLR